MATVAIIEVPATISKEQLAESRALKGCVNDDPFMAGDKSYQRRSLRYVGFVGEPVCESGGSRRAVKPARFAGHHRFEPLDTPDTTAQQIDFQTLHESHEQE